MLLTFPAAKNESPNLGPIHVLKLCNGREKLQQQAPIEILTYSTFDLWTAAVKLHRKVTYKVVVDSIDVHELMEKFVLLEAVGHCVRADSCLKQLFMYGAIGTVLISVRFLICARFAYNNSH